MLWVLKNGRPHPTRVLLHRAWGEGPGISHNKSDPLTSSPSTMDLEFKQYHTSISHYFLEKDKSDSGASLPAFLSFAKHKTTGLVICRHASSNISGLVQAESPSNLLRAEVAMMEKQHGT